LIASVPIALLGGLRLRRPLHHARNGAFGPGRHQQVHVIGHQYIGMHAAPGFQSGLAQVLQVAHIVHLAEEARLPFIAALDDVLRHARQVQSLGPRHPLVLPIRGMKHPGPTATTHRPGRAPARCQESLGQTIKKGTLTPVSQAREFKR
jgi:hypothetical protein